MKKLLFLLAFILFSTLAYSQKLTYSKDYNDNTVAKNKYGNIIKKDQYGNILGTYKKNYNGDMVYYSNS